MFYVCSFCAPPSRWRSLYPGRACAAAGRAPFRPGCRRAAAHGRRPRVHWRLAPVVAGPRRLDTIAPPRKRGGVSRTLSREKLERRLDDIIRRRGVEALNQMRDEARRIAPLIGRKEEFAAFDTLVGALPGTRDDDLVCDRPRPLHRRTCSAVRLRI
jgi:hypothetical protein